MRTGRRINASPSFRITTSSTPVNSQALATPLEAVGYIERGEIKPALAATYPLRDLVAAQEAFIAKRHTGNIVVTMTPIS